MQYHYKYAFFEIFTILKSNFPKTILSSILFEKTEFNPVLIDYKTEPINDTFSDTLCLRNHGLLKKKSSNRPVY